MKTQTNQVGFMSLLLSLPLLLIGITLLIAYEETAGGILIARARMIAKKITRLEETERKGCDNIELRKNEDKTIYLCTLSFTPTPTTLRSNLIVQSKLPRPERIFIPLDASTIIWTACQEPVNSLWETNNNKPLSSNSLLASTLCRTLTTAPTPHQGYTSNLSLLSLTQTPKLKVLATRGYLEIEKLNVKEPLLLYAGGDVFISELNAEKQTTIFIFSATGKVWIKKKTPKVLARVISYSESLVATPQQAENYSALPYEKNIRIRVNK
jgi:hypothetical protein